jgi:hypothetical protein
VADRCRAGPPEEGRYLWSSRRQGGPEPQSVQLRRCDRVTVHGRCHVQGDRRPGPWGLPWGLRATCACRGLGLEECWRCRGWGRRRRSCGRRPDVGTLRTLRAGGWAEPVQTRDTVERVTVLPGLGFPGTAPAPEDPVTRTPRVYPTPRPTLRTNPHAFASAREYRRGRRW